MQECWRWFGPADPISLREVAETGASGIVTALHHIPPGDLWTKDDINHRKAFIEGGHPSLSWAVVESLPVSEDIKRQAGEWRAHIDAWKQSLEHLAEAGLEVICYNFMPVLDWTRTHLGWELASSSTCMRFDLIDFAVADLFILKRSSDDYPADIVEAARARHANMSEAECDKLFKDVMCGLPGSLIQELTVEDVNTQLAGYGSITPDRLRQNLIDFLEDVVPVAERLGLRLCCHPDDPPFPLLGLPRVMSTEADYAAVMKAVDVPANGITLCSGSLGARADNDLPGMMRRLGDRVHFIHLRNVHREAAQTPCSFYESGHITGDVDMIDLICAIREEEERRALSGRADAHIPFRPDHGLHMSDDRRRDGQPGYPLVGRHVGLAELRGIIATSDRFRAMASGAH